MNMTMDLPLALDLPWIQHIFDRENVQDQLLTTIVVLVIVLILRGVAIRAITRQVTNTSHRYHLRRLANYSALAIWLIAAGSIWLTSLNANRIATYLGIVSAGVAIALKDPLTNLVAWGYIVSMRPFKVGDRVEVNGIRGDVVGEGPFAFVLLEIGNWVEADQSTGRVVNIPNASVFTHPLANYTLEFPYIWMETPVVLTFESDWQTMRGRLLKIGENSTEGFMADAQNDLDQASRLMINYGVLTPWVYTRAVDHGVELTLRSLIPVRGRRAVQDEIWREVLQLIESSPDLDLAYPTQRFVGNSPN